MNFFERQAAARRQSRWLLLMFAVSVLATVLAVDVLVLVAMGGLQAALERPQALIVTSLVTAGAVGIASLVKMATLRGSGAITALGLGASVVPADTPDASLRRLRNVVEEIAIASGVPMPEVFVLEREAGINAFAAGWSPRDAAVAVTRGALDRLNRDELQGVVAHEFSHILHGDMRLNLRLIGLLGGLTVIGLAGRKLAEAAFSGERRGIARIGSDRDRIGGAAVVAMIGLFLVVVGWIGVTAGRLIRAGLSRQRELLADASAVQFTRQAAGLAGALKKIGGLPEGARLQSPARAEEVAHMLFGDGVGLRGWLSGLFATHPSVLERVRALEPGFNEAALGRLAAAWARLPPQGAEEDARLGFAPAGALPPIDAELSLRPAELVAGVAEPADADLERARAIIAALPEPLVEAVRDREAAPALVLALLLSTRPEIRRQQRAEVEARLGEAFALKVLGWQGAVAGLHPQLRLPLAELAFPRLRARAPTELRAIVDACYALVHADGEVEVFEYCLGLLLHRQLLAAEDPAARPPAPRRLVEVEPSATTLLAVIAGAGHADPAHARRAFLAGLARVFPRSTATWITPIGGVRALDQGWDALQGLEPLSKAMLLEALVEAASHDGRLAVAELELLRTVSALLDCPLPPGLGRGATAA